MSGFVVGWTALLVMGVLQGGGGGQLRTLARGTHSGITRAENRVIRTPEEWQRLWAEHTAATQPRPALPAVDFGREMVVAVYLGEQRTGGYSVEVTGVEKKGKGLVVTARRAAPPPGGITMQALTQPFHLVAVPKREGEVTFSIVPAAGRAKKGGAGEERRP